ncbi:MAG: hypothetical protein ACI94Y_003423 [Maribacter sp.]|jgi:hypothetical protein
MSFRSLIITKNRIKFLNYFTQRPFAKYYFNKIGLNNFKYQKEQQVKILYLKTIEKE